MRGGPPRGPRNCDRRPLAFLQEKAFFMKKNIKRVGDFKRSASKMPFKISWPRINSLEIILFGIVRFVINCYGVSKKTVRRASTRLSTAFKKKTDVSTQTDETADHEKSG